MKNVNLALSILGERHHDDIQMSKSKKIYEEKFDEDLTQKIKSKYRFCDRDLKKFCLILQKAAYQYEYIDNQQKLHGTSLPTNNEFYSNTQMQDIKDAD